MQPSTKARLGARRSGASGPSRINPRRKLHATLVRHHRFARTRCIDLDRLRPDAWRWRRIDHPDRWQYRSRQFQPPGRRQPARARRRDRRRQRQGRLPGHEKFVQGLSPQGRILGRPHHQQRHLHPRGRPTQGRRRQFIRGQHIRPATRHFLWHGRDRRRSRGVAHAQGRWQVEHLRDHRPRFAAGGVLQRRADSRCARCQVCAGPVRFAVRQWRQQCAWWFDQVAQVADQGAVEPLTARGCGVQFITPMGFGTEVHTGNAFQSLSRDPQQIE